MALPGASATTMVMPPDGYHFKQVRSGRKGGTANLSVRIEGLRTVQQALREAGGDAPFVRAALERVGARLRSEMAQVMPHDSFKVGQPRVLGKAPAQRVVVDVEHPGARSYEFGRVWYYRAFKGRAMKSGYKFRSSPGQMARPYLGVVKGSGVADKIQPYAEQEIVEAYQQEWERLTATPVAGDVIEVAG